MPIDANIPLQVRQPQLMDPTESLNRVLTLRGLAGQQQLQQMQLEQAQRTTDQERTLADLYKGNVNPDGTVNRQGVIGGAAQRGLGARIPAMQKQFAEADEATIKNQKLKSEAGEIDFNVAKKRMEVSAGALQSLLASPNLTHQNVIDTMVGLVNQGIVTPEQGQQAIRELPGDIPSLRQYLMQKGIAVMDAAKRLEALTPKFDKVNNGKTTSFVDTNTLTNPGGPKAIQMTTTPGEDQSAATQRRGQNMTDSRERQLASQTMSYQQDADGNIVALPTKGVPGQVIKATPVTASGPGMQPLQGKSSMTEDQAKASGWLAQASNAWKNMQDAMGGVDPKTGAFKNAGVAQPGLADAVANIPSLGIGEVVGNSMRSPARQKFMQASSSLSEAVLRAATGAGVNKEEAAQKVRELTPVFGESPETTKQKMEAIPVYLQSLQMRAGPGARKVMNASAPNAAPTTTDVPPEIRAIINKHGGK